MGLLLNGLLSACTITSQTPNDLQACQKATQAGLQQSGIQQTVDSFEDRQVHYLDGKAKEWLGLGGYYTVGGAYIIARTVQTKSVHFKINRYFSFEAGPQQTVLHFELGF